jgi:hypothetical protein
LERLIEIIKNVKVLKSGLNKKNINSLSLLNRQCIASRNLWVDLIMEMQEDFGGIDQL